MSTRKQLGMTRREVLHRAAAAAALAVPWIAPARALGLGGALPPSERIGVGVIGTGGRGTFLVHDLLRRPACQVVAVCDVHAGRRAAAQRAVDAAGGGKGCAAAGDFRDLLARDDVDAVVIASPDHWHALQTIAAARASKDVYCEKPLTHTVEEGKAVVAAVRRHGIVFQHGTQQRSERSFRVGAELVRNGRIGQLRTIRLGVPSGQSIGPQPPTPVPPDLDYEMWLGPAPWAPHTPKRVESSHSWYWISDYCVGYIAGWGVHHIDSAQQGNGTDLTGPVEVEGSGIFPREGLYDTAIQWRLEIRFSNGVTMVDADVSRERMGVTYEGTEGTVYTWRDNRLETRPESLAKETVGPEGIHVYSSDDHMGNFLECIRTRKETAAPVEVAHRSTTICNIGAIAMRLGRKLRWDPEKERFAGDDEANRMLFRTYREPWTL
ncbi:MAG TPA: Gfo/Idh/MocA family oxidoreductase [Planctomycetota bacterium]|nr:Gfo/Idh/MocA family oxidoreductase [Planctomycetota bacterium]